MNLRIFNIYGRYIKNSNNFIDFIIDSCLLNKEINLIEDRYFDIFYIENLRSILLKIINSEILSDYNLVHQKKYKISELISFISNYLDSSSKLTVEKTGKDYTGENILRIKNIDLIDPLDDLKEYINKRKTGLFSNFPINFLKLLIFCFFCSRTPSWLRPFVAVFFAQGDPAVCSMFFLGG